MGVRRPEVGSPVFLTGKLMPLGPKKVADPLAGVTGVVGIPDLLTAQREKVPDMASISFASCVERFDTESMLRRMRLAQMRMPPPSMPYDTGLASLNVPKWDWSDEPPQE